MLIMQLVARRERLLSRKNGDHGMENLNDCQAKGRREKPFDRDLERIFSPNLKGLPIASCLFLKVSYVIRMNFFPRTSLLTTLLVASTLLGQPRDLRFEHFSVEQGLSNFTIYSIVQDRHGFLWIGTEDGLNRFDGYTFTVFKNHPADSSSLPGQTVPYLYIDRAGTLWVIADGILCRYDPARESFERLHHPEFKIPDAEVFYVTIVLEDRAGEFWIATTHGLFRHHRTRNTFVLYRHDPSEAASLNHNSVTRMVEDDSGDLWLATSARGLMRFLRKENRFRQYDYSPIAGIDLTQCLLRDHRGVIWIGASSGLYYYDAARDQVLPFRPETRQPENFYRPNFVVSLHEDRQHTLWIGFFHRGLWRYNAATGHLIQYQHDANKPHGLPSNRVDLIYEDRSHVLWVATYRSGLHRYVRRQDAFTRYWTNSPVHAILQDHHGAVWIGSLNKGLWRFAADGTLLKQHRHESHNPQSLSNDNVQALYEDAQGEMWLATGAGVNRMHLASERFTYHQFGPRTTIGADHYEVKNIFADRDGEIWFGTRGRGLGKWDRALQKIVLAETGASTAANIPHHEIWHIAQDRHGDLWLGSFGGGLIRFDRKRNLFTSYRRDPRNPHSLSNSGIYVVYADTNDAIWAGTFGGGLNKLDPRTGQVTHFTEREGLPNNFVKSILPDAHGNFWLSTDNGLARFHPQTLAVKHFTQKDGLLTNQFLSGAYFKNAEGRMFFGGEGGAISFHPDSLRDNTYVPPIVITRFKVFDRVLPPLPQALPPGERAQQGQNLAARIHFSYRDNFFSFEFVALDFTDPPNNQYAYRLEGFDAEWVQAGTRRYASYTNVPPGEYTFRVKGSNSDGVWNEEGVAVRMVITPPVWQTWWFRVSAAVLAALLGYGVYRYRVNRLLEMERLRTRLSADLHDDIAGNLSSIALFGKIVQDEAAAAGEKKSAESELLQRMVVLAQESVTAIREIIWAIDPKPETFFDLLLRVRDFAANACRAQNMQFKFEAPSQAALPTKNLLPEQRKHLWLLLKEAILNAVKHSGGSELAIHIAQQTTHFTFNVIDNGAGLNGARNESRFSGKGLHTMKVRAEQLNGTFEILALEKGTAVIVKVKI